jgi:flagellar protein FliS
MPASARNHYLETEVLTGTPQKLHLLLIEAAMRFAERTRRHWRDGNREKAFQSLILAQEAVAKMLSGLDLQDPSPLVREIASVYHFIFRALVDANRRRDERKLDEALRVLSIERETWRLVCQQNVDPEKGDSPPLPGPTSGRCPPGGYFAQMGAVPLIPPEGRRVAGPLSQGFRSAPSSFSREA